MSHHLSLQPTRILDDDPDNVLSKFLPELKELNMNELNLYLLSELAITDNDVIRLTEAPRLPKCQVAMNLYHIIKSRHTLPQFLKALERSSKDNPGHEELHGNISKERERRIASQRIARSKSLTLNKAQHSTTSFFSLPGEVECQSSGHRIQEKVRVLKVEPKDENERDLPLSSSSITMSVPTCVELTPSHSDIYDQMSERNVRVITKTTETERLKSKLHSIKLH